MERLTFLLAAFVYGIVLLRLAVVDVRTGYLPDRLVLPLGALGILLSAAGVLSPLAVSFAGAAFGGGLFYESAVALGVREGGMGGGDVKLAAAIGAWTGMPAVLPALFAAFFLGSLAALFLLCRGVRRRATLPFGPFLAAGGLLGLVSGERIVRFYCEVFL